MEIQNSIGNCGPKPPKSKQLEIFPLNMSVEVLETFSEEKNQTKIDIGEIKIGDEVKQDKQDVRQSGKTDFKDNKQSLKEESKKKENAQPNLGNFKISKEPLKYDAKLNLPDQRDKNVSIFNNNYDYTQKQKGTIPTLILQSLFEDNTYNYHDNSNKRYSTNTAMFVSDNNTHINCEDNTKQNSMNLWSVIKILCGILLLLQLCFSWTVIILIFVYQEDQNSHIVYILLGLQLAVIIISIIQIWRQTSQYDYYFDLFPDHLTGVIYSILSLFNLETIYILLIHHSTDAITVFNLNFQNKIRNSTILNSFFFPMFISFLLFNNKNSDNKSDNNEVNQQELYEFSPFPSKVCNFFLFFIIFQAAFFSIHLQFFKTEFFEDTIESIFKFLGCVCSCCLKEFEEENEDDDYFEEASLARVNTDGLSSTVIQFKNTPLSFYNLCTFLFKKMIFSLSFYLILVDLIIRIFLFGISQNPNSIAKNIYQGEIYIGGGIIFLILLIGLVNCLCQISNNYFENSLVVIVVCMQCIFVKLSRSSINSIFQGMSKRQLLIMQLFPGIIRLAEIFIVQYLLYSQYSSSSTFFEFICNNTSSQLASIINYLSILYCLSLIIDFGFEIYQFCNNKQQIPLELKQQLSQIGEVDNANNNNNSSNNKHTQDQEQQQNMSSSNANSNTPQIISEDIIQSLPFSQNNPSRLPIQIKGSKSNSHNHNYEIRSHSQFNDCFNINNEIRVKENDNSVIELQNFHQKQQKIPDLEASSHLTLLNISQKLHSSKFQGTRLDRKMFTTNNDQSQQNSSLNKSDIVRMEILFKTQSDDSKQRQDARRQKNGIKQTTTPPKRIIDILDKFQNYSSFLKHKKQLKNNQNDSQQTSINLGPIGSCNQLTQQQKQKKHHNLKSDIYSDQNQIDREQLTSQQVLMLNSQNNKVSEQQQCKQKISI